MNMKKYRVIKTVDFFSKGDVYIENKEGNYTHESKELSEFGEVVKISISVMHLCVCM